MRTALALVSLGLLTSCGSPSVSQIGQACGSADKTFVQYWPCQKTRIANEITAPDDIKAMYFAIGDAVRERILQKQMTDAEGRLLMAKAYQEAVQEDASRRRVGSMAASGPVSIDIPWAPTALPAGAVAGPQPAQPPRTPIYCNRVGHMTTCF